MFKSYFHYDYKADPKTTQARSFDFIPPLKFDAFLPKCLKTSHVLLLKLSSYILENRLAWRKTPLIKSFFKIMSLKMLLMLNTNANNWNITCQDMLMKIRDQL